MDRAFPHPPHSGLVRVPQHHPALWRFVLIAANLGAFVLLLLLTARPIGGSMLPGFITGIIIWAATDAVLVPIARAQQRKELELDFTSGTITAGGTRFPASAFTAAIETTRRFPGNARLLTLAYEGGIVEFQVDGFAPTAAIRARNAALQAFIHEWLRLPATHRSLIDESIMVTRRLIGLDETMALLRSEDG